MGESYKGEYSAEAWEDNFLAKAKSELPEKDRMRFLASLKSNKINEGESQEFLDAFLAGNEKINEFLKKRGEVKIEKDERIEGEITREFGHIASLPEKPETETPDDHKIAA